MRISDWSSDVCSSDLFYFFLQGRPTPTHKETEKVNKACHFHWQVGRNLNAGRAIWDRSEEHTSELQSLMRISYAVFCLKKKKNQYNTNYVETNNKHNLINTAQRSMISHNK